VLSLITFFLTMKKFLFELYFGISYPCYLFNTDDAL
jgi:hypothetical protein